ncbi:pirin family protein [Pedobacter gandavensis]|uniref:Pirin family protein n=1 Tax=Pedobacter gandavensis TaxID=2679963 RepID=A0ABR6F1X1_9SPHI|nr:pirin family protein [Pedobacter gandavensis]MBB2151216.1 pirin family protein [Pedobacter gandavensis]
MAKTVLHKADSRSIADHGWLKSFQTFSFGGNYNPERIQFGALRVLNDDYIDGGTGFGEHPHDNMEIISIVLEGGLKHEDSMHNVAVIEPGEVQVMSAGTGIYHQEYNNDEQVPAKFLQIWLFPNQRNVTPRYQQERYDKNLLPNQFTQILSPNPDDAGVWIYQDAWFHLGKFEAGLKINHPLKHKKNGIYVFVIKGTIQVNGQDLADRDGFGLWEIDALEINTLTEAEVLLIEVPMN